MTVLRVLGFALYVGGGDCAARPEEWDHRKDRFGALNLFKVELRVRFGCWA